jgi:hypothetical protein
MEYRNFPWQRLFTAVSQRQYNESCFRELNEE